MDRASFEAVDEFISATVVASDPDLDAALAAAEAAGLPSIQVSPPQGKLLQILVRLLGAESVLEFGTLGGYSTILMARALAPGGRLISLEADPRHAEVARASLDRAGVGDRVEIRVGPALETLPLWRPRGRGRSTSSSSTPTRSTRPTTSPGRWGGPGRAA
jgi:predicted O-methyltransferase YrrM